MYRRPGDFHACCQPRQLARRSRTGILCRRRSSGPRITRKELMFSRAYRAAVTVPPLAWVAAFLLVPYGLLFCYSFWSVSPAQAIVHSWNLDNYRELLSVDVYLQTLFRSMWIAARIMIFSLLLG